MEQEEKTTELQINDSTLTYTRTRDKEQTNENWNKMKKVIFVTMDT